MEEDFRLRFDQLEKKIDAAYASSEKVRKYLFWTGVVTIVLFVVPLLGIALIAPSAFSTYSSPDVQSLLQ